MFYLSDENVVEELKDALKIITNDEDKLINDYIQTAEIKIQSSVGEGITDFYARDTVKPLYKQAVFALAGAYYTYRIALSDTKPVDVDLSYNSILQTLAGKYQLAEMEANHDETTNTI